MSKTAATDAMWAAYRAAGGPDHDRYDVVCFAEGTGWETALAELVLAGTKRATASLMRSFDQGREPPPMIGGHAVTVDGAGQPRCIFRTVELRLGRLDSVDDRFAWDEGEGDRTRGWWLDAHRQFFGSQAARDGFTLGGGIETVFERFRVVWPPEAADDGGQTAIARDAQHRRA